MNYKNFTLKELEIINDYFLIERNEDDNSFKLEHKEKFDLLCCKIQYFIDCFANSISCGIDSQLIKSLCELVQTIEEGGAKK